MTPTPRETRVISQLLKETQEGKLKWESLNREVDEIPGPGSEARVEESYRAERAGYMLRLCSYKDKDYTDVDEWRWVDGVLLETGKNDTPTWWSFPSMNLTWDLLRAVQFQVNDVGGFFTAVLSSDDEL